MTDFQKFNEEIEATTIFCDMDGVITDFEQYFIDFYGESIKDIQKPKNYKMINALPQSWWESMPWMSDGKELWKFLTDISLENNLYILSTPAQDPENKSLNGKIQWLKDEGITSQIGEDHIIIKENKSSEVRPGKSILVDDTPKKIEGWEEAGGIGILHVNTQDTIEQLKKHGF